MRLYIGAASSGFWRELCSDKMLRRGVQQPLRALGSRLLSGSSASSAAAPAVAVAAKKGFLSQLLGGSSRVSVPMTEALPGVVEPTPVVFDKAPVTQTTTLPNGVRIVSENTPVRDVWMR